jgi:hypothetical protein
MLLLLLLLLASVLLPCLLQVLRSAIKLLIRLRRHESVRLDRAMLNLGTASKALL